jgi:hypothetical protein
MADRELFDERYQIDHENKLRNQFGTRKAEKT